MPELSEEEESNVYMACIMQGHRIGVSYYDASTRQLHVLEIWEDGSHDFSLVDMVKYQAKPGTIYTSTKSEESFLGALQRSDGTSDAPSVKLVKSSLFSHEQAWHRLMYLQVTGMDDGLNIKERTAFEDQDLKEQAMYQKQTPWRYYLESHYLEFHFGLVEWMTDHVESFRSLFQDSGFFLCKRATLLFVHRFCC
uniref:DNA mismatch repair protein MSH5-like n=1 Tax=Nicotiana sylvestris TaxID=4096 RepID=A0A1U7VN53_NICSY|nr:PREDICTED: DNA mismatch repair protein MSH5-like [Nicotiana sylvestris]